jgi:putative membrane protein
MTLAPLLAIVVAAGLYWAGVRRLARRGVHWSAHRHAAYCAGLAAVAVALIGPLATHDEDVRAHVAQHLLLGMLAPLLFALSAPVTLFLRALPPRRRPAVARLLHSRAARMLTYPLFTAALSVGSLSVLYFSGLYAATLRSETLHVAVHLHMLAAGSLFAWSVVGLDPVPHRPALRLRAVALVAALAGRGILTKLLYAHAGSLAGASGSPDDWRQAAQLMWYGGDLVDLGLLIAFFGQWYRASGRSLERVQRAGPGAHPTA